jgi:hypothetical protein
MHRDGANEVAEETAKNAQTISPQPIGSPWRRAKLSVCAIAFALVACGDSPPAPSGQGPWSYWSTDMSPVKITFKRVDPVPGAKLPPDMVIPRAYIKYALPYKWPTPKTMPDVATDVEVGSLILFLAHDTGEPLPMAESRIGSSDPDGVDRLKYTYVQVYYSPIKREPGFNKYEKPPPRPEAWQPGMPVDEDGIVRVDSPNGLYLISGCKVRGGEPPRATLFCTYRARLTAKISVAAHFADYRAMGGLPFVERVLSVIKEKLCQFSDCTN